MTGTWWVSDKDLDADQAQAIQGIDERDSFLIQGPAGSGKTNILLLRAKWLRLRNLSNFKIVVFTKTLRDFIGAGCGTYGVPEQCVVTSYQLFRSLLEEYGVAFEPTGDFEADRMLLAGKAQSLVDTRGIQNVFECLLVDECQDYLDTELLVLRRLAARLALAADSRQSIYRATHAEGLLEKLVDGNVISLKYHYRSGLKLCKVADAILRDSATFQPVYSDSQYDEDSRPSSVTLNQFSSLEEQFIEILGHLPAQLDAYPNEQIGVLFPKKEQVAAFLSSLERTYGSNPEFKRVHAATMHGAKGLEFRAVHLGGCEALYRMGPTQKRLIYTSILRGRTAVAIYFSGNIPGYLDSAVAQLSPPKPPPALSELFG